MQKRQERAKRLADKTLPEIIQQSTAQVPQKKPRIEYAAPPLAVMQSRGSLLTIQDCPTLRAIGKYFDRLTVPSQVASLLQSRFATWAYLAHSTGWSDYQSCMSRSQILLIIDKSTKQLSAWLSHTLEDAVMGSSLTQENYESSEELLRLVVDHCRFTKVCWYST